MENSRVHPSCFGIRETPDGTARCSLGALRACATVRVDRTGITLVGVADVFTEQRTGGSAPQRSIGTFAEFLTASAVEPSRSKDLAVAMTSSDHGAIRLGVSDEEGAANVVQIRWQRLADGNVASNQFRVIIDDVAEMVTSLNVSERAMHCMAASLEVSEAMVVAGSSTSEWSFATPGFLQYTGLALDDSRARGWNRLLADDDARRLTDVLATALHVGSPPPKLTLPVLRHDGAARRCALRFLIIGPSPSALERWFISFREIEQELWADQRIMRLRDELVQRSAERDGLLRQVVDTQESERSRVAAELHDQLGQSVTALRVTAVALVRNPASQDTQVQFDSVIAQLDRQLDMLTFSLRPMTLEEAGLEAAVAAYARDWAAQHKVQYDQARDPRFPQRLRPSVELGLFRIVLAALDNVGEHAQARRVSVTFGVEKSTVYVIIEDDGRGFSRREQASIETPSPRNGMSFMQERARYLGGSCEWESNPGSGTTVYVRVPSELATRVGDRNETVDR